jgi:hypothetical protein
MARPIEEPEVIKHEDGREDYVLRHPAFVPISKIEEMKPKSHGILMGTLPEWMAIEKGLV